MLLFIRLGGGKPISRILATTSCKRDEHLVSNRCSGSYLLCGAFWLFQSSARFWLGICNRAYLGLVARARVQSGGALRRPWVILDDGSLYGNPIMKKRLPPISLSARQKLASGRLKLGSCFLDVHLVAEAR